MPTLLRLATELEGHPDNVAACLAGGLTIAWTSASGPQAARLAPVAGLTPVRVRSGRCRWPPRRRARLLPPPVPHADAAANAARAALLIAALTRDPGLLLAGTEDFLHQRVPRRGDAGHGRPGRPAAGRRHPGGRVRRRARRCSRSP